MGKLSAVALGGYLLVAGGAGLIGTAGYTFWSAQHSQAELAQQFNQQKEEYAARAQATRSPRTSTTGQTQASNPAPVPFTPPAPGKVLAELSAPSIGLRTYVLEGDSDAILAKGPGHMPGTAYPGQTNNMIVAAHNVLYFEHIDGLHPGDPIYVSLPNGERYTYTVSGHKIISTNAYIPIRPMPPTLTLVSCYPLNGSILHPPWRYLVMARLSGTKKVG